MAVSVGPDLDLPRRLLLHGLDRSPEEGLVPDELPERPALGRRLEVQEARRRGVGPEHLLLGVGHEDPLGHSLEHRRKIVALERERRDPLGEGVGHRVERPGGPVAEPAAGREVALADPGGETLEVPRAQGVTAEGRPAGQARGEQAGHGPGREFRAHLRWATARTGGSASR
jgi:hypothetical protein